MYLKIDDYKKKEIIYKKIENHLCFELKNRNYL